VVAILGGDIGARDDPALTDLALTEAAAFLASR